MILGGVATNYAYDSKGNMTIAGDRAVDYTVFNKPDRIMRNGIETLFRYGPERNRFYQQQTSGPDITRTRYYGGFEVVENNGTVREKTYLGDYLVHNTVRQFGGTAVATDVRYLHRDHIGSVDAITDTSGIEIERMAFAPFGSRRQANWENSDAVFEASLADKTFDNTTRGFTDHEHLDAVGFIHMNGRMYDPQIGRFVSPDDYVQFPEFSQSYNRYSYVLNNPLTHTDESGELIPALVYGAVVAWRAYSAYDTVTTTVAESKVLLDENAATSDRVVSGLSIAASVVGGKPARGAVSKFSDKVKKQQPKRTSAEQAKSSQPERSKGNDKNTEKVEETSIAANGSGRSRAASSDQIAQSSNRGLSKHGGVISSTTNSSGGEVVTAVGKINQNDIAPYVNSGLYKGDVNIISGAHGSPSHMIPDIGMFKDDVARFGDIPGVKVHDITKMKSSEITEILNSPGTTIGGFCDSASCLEPFK